jgi:GNAT superfamily N-acetyltransferase
VIGMPTFRRATAEDIPLLRTLAADIWRRSYREMLTAEQIDYMLAWMYGAETIRAEIAAGIWWEVIELDGAAIGYLAAERGADVKLHKLYLLPEQQGRGFAQRALDRVLELARTWGAARVILNVNKHNARALRAYERAGFSVIEAVVNDIGGGFVMDDFIMARAVALETRGQTSAPFGG